MAGVKSVGEDAAFDSNLCWAWWPGSPSAVAECLDGRTGLVNYDDDNTDEQETKPPEFSDCSTFALFQLNLDILRSSGVSTMATIGKSQPNLVSLRQLKCHVSPQYESAKTDFFRHRVFDQWSRRDCG